MNKFGRSILLAAVLAFPQILAAQSFGIGARAGTLGVGPEAAVGLNDSFVIRAGYGLFPIDYTDEVDGQEYTVTFPSSYGSLGVDLYLGGGNVRFMGGVLFRSGDVEVETAIQPGDDIGGIPSTEAGRLLGRLEQSAVAPYVGIGFGKHTEGRFGFFLDLGVALAGEADVKLDAEGAIESLPDLQQRLRDQEEKIKEDVGDYLKLWPVVSLGIKIPIG